MVVLKMRKLGKLSIKMRNKWLYIYILFFICMVSLLLGVHLKMEKMISEYANQHNSSVLKRVISEIDAELKNIQRFIINIPLDEEFYSFAGRESLSMSDCMEYYGIDKKILSYAESNGIGNNYSIYLKNSGIVLNSNGYITATSGLSRFLENSQYSFSEFERLLQNNFYLEYVVIKPADTSADSKILLLHSLPNGVVLQKSCIIIVEINSEKINGLLANSNFSGSVSLFDKNGNILCSFGTGRQLSELPDNYESDKVYIKNTENEKFLVSISGSGFGKYTYAATSSLTGYINNITLIRTIIALMIFFILAGSGLFLIYYIKKSYLPMQNIIEQVENTVLENSAQMQSTPYNNPERKLQILEGNLNKHIKKYHHGRNAVLNSIFHKLLSFEFNEVNISEFEDVFSQYSENNIVIIIESENYEDFFDGESQVDYIETFCFLIRNVLGEFLAEMPNLIFDFERFVVCVLAVNSIESHENTLFLTEVFNSLIRFFNKELGISLTVGIGSVEAGVKGIRKSFLNAGEAIAYSAAFPDEKIFNYCDINKRTNKFFYTALEENIFINYIKSGNFALSKKHVDDIIEKNLTKHSISYEYMKFLLFNLALTVSKATEKEFEEQLFPSSVGVHVREIFKSCHDVSEFKEKLYFILERYSEKMKENRNDRTIQNIVEAYLEENYTNSILGNEDIAEYCNLSPAYLSTVFKKNCKENLVDYISKFRIEKAKELYLLTNINIGDIAEKVGFVNSNTFIRAFKKYEGITPGQWRKNHMQQ